MEIDIPAFSLTDTNKIIEEIPELANNSDFLIIDFPTSAQELTRAILFVSDSTVIPVQPSGLDDNIYRDS